MSLSFVRHLKLPMLRKYVHSGPRLTIRVGLLVSSIHFVAFLISVWLSRQGEGWAGVFVWPLWLAVDFPLSLLHAIFFAPGISEQLQFLREGSPFLSYILYSPYLIHGFAGTVWWFFVPALYLRLHRRSSE
jgi:hypothetical protein